MKPISEKVDNDLLMQAIKTDGFNSEVIDDDEMAFYLEQLKDWLGYVPTPEATDFPPLNCKNIGLECPIITNIEAITG